MATLERRRTVVSVIERNTRNTAAAGEGHQEGEGLRDSVLVEALYREVGRTPPIDRCGHVGRCGHDGEAALVPLQSRLVPTYRLEEPHTNEKRKKEKSVRVRALHRMATEEWSAVPIHAMR